MKFLEPHAQVLPRDHKNYTNLKLTNFEATDETKVLL